MQIEAITLNAADTLQAEKLGAHRVELVSAMKDGGLTPSYGTIKNVLGAVNIPVQIMVRPHGDSFVYNETDWEAMKEDILAIKSLGGNRIVTGAITPEGNVDEAFLEKVVELVPDFNISFHRAFDEVNSQIDAYKTLAKYSRHIKQILTSGGKPTATDGRDTLKELVALSNELDGPRILVGSGVHPENVQELHQYIGADQYHIGSGLRIDKDFSKGLDQKKMEKVKEALNI